MHRDAICLLLQCVCNMGVLAYPLLLQVCGVEIVDGDDDGDIYGEDDGDMELFVCRAVGT